DTPSRKTPAARTSKRPPKLAKIAKDFVERSSARFIDAHGFRFSRSDHIKLIKLMYLVMVKKDQWHDVTHKDLVLEWEPVYDLYYGAAYGKLEDVDGGKNPKANFQTEAILHRPSESPKIWEKIQVLLAPRYSAKEFCEMALLFLNIRMSTEARSKMFLRAKSQITGSMAQPCGSRQCGRCMKL
ncbi:hypothetical protein OSTOST_18393, partial [Ostertagia ostertagi]